MKDKFKNALLALVKDYGLSDKYINDLVEQAVAGLADDATEEAITAHANLYSSIAKLAQGEVTRKVQAVKDTLPKPKGNEDEDKKPIEPITTKGMDEETRKAFEALQKQVRDLAEANAKAQALAEAQAKAVQHQTIVKESATKLGLSHELALSLDTSKAETAEDVEKTLANFQQILVNEGLPTKGVSATVIANEEKQMQADAEAFANAL